MSRGMSMSFSKNDQNVSFVSNKEPQLDEPWQDISVIESEQGNTANNRINPTELNTFKIEKVIEHPLSPQSPESKLDDFDDDLEDTISKEDNEQIATEKINIIQPAPVKAAHIISQNDQVPDTDSLKIMETKKVQIPERKGIEIEMEHKLEPKEIIKPKVQSLSKDKPRQVVVNRNQSSPPATSYSTTYFPSIKISSHSIILAAAGLAVLLVYNPLNKDFLLGVLVALILAPISIYFVIRNYLLQDVSDTEVGGIESDVSTRLSDEELCGWMQLKEGGRKKPVYVHLKGSNLRITSKDATTISRSIDLKRGVHRLQILSPYKKLKRRLKHLWDKQLPLVISLEHSDKIVLFIRECKEKETWFWTLYKHLHSTEPPPVSSLDKSDNKDWFNLILGRAFRDFIAHPKWRRWIRRKCQQKLRKLPLPQFVDPLKVRRVALSSSFPKLTKPTGHMDSDGQAVLSFQLDASANIDEQSIVEMTLETRLNASYFTTFRETPETDQNTDNDIGNVSDEDGDDMEVSFDTLSSSDTEDEEEASHFDPLPLDESSHSNLSELSSMVEDPVPPPIVTVAPIKSTGSRSLMDKLREKGSVLLNKNKTVRKYFDDLVSSSQLTVTVKVVQLKGTLLLAQPDWPSDRLWFRMAAAPELKLTVDLKHGNAGRPLIKSNWLRNQLEERLRKHLVTVLCTFDDVTLHPLLLLPSALFSSTQPADEQERLIIEKI